MKIKSLPIFLVIILLAGFNLNAQPPQVQVGDIIASAHGDAGDVLLKLDRNTGIGQFLMNTPVSTTEIVFNQDGLLYMEESDGGTTLWTIDVMTAATNLLGNHPCCAMNGMEFVNGILYGTNISEGGGPSTLVIVDMNTIGYNYIGLTGYNQITSLAQDPMTGVVYGTAIVDNGGGGGADSPINSMLVTIDLNTGVATPIGPIGEVVGGMDFANDGTLYAGTVHWSANPGFLITIDKNTGLSTPIGPTGYTDITGIAIYPGEEIPINFTLVLIIFGVLAVGLITWRTVRI